MDQRSIVLYLSRKRLSAVAIHDDLVATLGAEAVGYPSVTRYLREAIFASSNPPYPLSPPEDQLDDHDRLSSSCSPINASHQFASYQDSHTYQERLSTDN
jgi:hypothetical protein